MSSMLQPVPPSAPVEATRILAGFAVDLRWEHMPSKVVQEAKRALVDCLGVAYAGSRDPVAEKTLKVYAARGGKAEAHLVGHDRKLDLLSATLLNGIAMHALDFDDTHADFFYHGTVPVAPAVWALGETLHCTGRELLTAFVVGWEVGARIARAVYPALYLKGWQGTATVGTFAATAAAGRLLGLDEHGMRNAFGLAAAQAGGTRQMLGTMSKPFQVGKASMNGVLSALLSKEGVTSSLVALEAPLGFVALTASKFDLTLAVRDRFENYELLRNTYKPYPCCLKHHAVVDAFLSLQRDHGVTPARLRQAVCTVYPALLDTANVDEPATGAEGKFSVQHSAAVALADGAAALPQYTDERVRDPLLAALRKKLKFVADARIGPAQCELQVECTDGARIRLKIEHAQGGIDRPLSDDEIEAKFLTTAASVAGADRLKRTLEEIRSLETVPDVALIPQAW